MMSIARIEGDAVAEVRFIALTDVPEHKRHVWRQIEGEPPSYDINAATISGPTYAVHPDKVVATWTLTPKPLTSEQISKMADIAARCSSPDEAVASAAQGIMDEDATRTSQTREQRIAYWLSAHAADLLATADAVLARPA